jgi:hypothetical protein
MYEYTCTEKLCQRLWECSVMKEEASKWKNCQDALFKTERFKNNESGIGRQVDMSARVVSWGSVSRLVRWGALDVWFRLPAVQAEVILSHDRTGERGPEAAPF